MPRAPRHYLTTVRPSSIEALHDERDLDQGFRRRLRARTFSRGLKGRGVADFPRCSRSTGAVEATAPMRGTP